MYETHFGLTSKPFATRAKGAAVFVGPQQAEVVRGLGKGLHGADAIVTVSGPVGSGKTTIVNRALESMSPGRLVAWVGRMHLSESEVLELLLAGFGIAPKATGRIQRFATFRHVLAERCANGPRVAIVVEDAQRVGVEALAELEALTADEDGDGIAANIVLMGQPSLNDLLNTPELARLRQRVRLRHSIRRLSAAEVRGYLKHSIRAAGGDYANVFDDLAAEKIFECSEGIPRVINAICELAFTRAAENDQSRVSATLISAVAAEVFGFEESAASPVNIPTDAAIAASETSDEPEIRITGEAKTSSSGDDCDAASANEPFAASVTPIRPPEAALERPRITVESGKYSDDAESDIETGNRKCIMAQVEEDAEAGSGDAHELIDDTQPSLAKLAYADAPGDQETDSSQAAEESDTADIPVLAVGDVADSSIATADLPEEDKTPAGKPVDEISAERAAEEAMQMELDAALSIELDSTNVMEGLTRDLEHASTGLRTGSFRNIAEKNTADAEDLPTLSSSMRVHSLPKNDTGEFAEPGQAGESDSTDADAPATEGEQQDSSSADADSDKAEATLADEEPAMDESMFFLEDTFSRRTNIDVLEAALKEAKTFDYTDTPPVIPAFHEARATGETTTSGATIIPEITLDEALPVPAMKSPLADGEKAADRNSDTYMDRLAHDIGNAHSLEDISDLMAETLFGTEFEQIAADAVAMPPQKMAELELQQEKLSPVKLDMAESPSPADEAPQPARRKSDVKPETSRDALKDKPISTGELLRRAAEKQNKPPPLPSGDELKASMAMRIEMLNAMKNGGDAMPRSATPPAPARESAPPEPIENQIDTSLTATLQTLSLAKMQEVEEDKKEKKSGGLFSRFRKSS